MRFGQWLTNELELCGITAEELSRRTGLSGTYIRNLANDKYPSSKDGKGRPSEESIEKIVKGLKSGQSAINYNEYLSKARAVAGYKSSRSDIPDEILVVGFDGLDQDDLREIANFINYKKEQKKGVVRDSRT